MARNNDVFKVLVTKNNQSLLPAGRKVTQLAPGQIGIFDFKSNLSISGTENVREFYLAVGVGTGSTLTDVIKSTGSHIQTRNVTAFSFRPHTAGRNQKVKIANYLANCDTEYGIRIDFKNQEIYRTQGYNNFTKVYTTLTSPCVDCSTDCPSGDANEITKALFVQINNDPSKLVKATILPRGSVTAAGVPSTNLTVAHLDTIINYNKTASTKVYTDLEIEFLPQLPNLNRNLDLKYFFPRVTIGEVFGVGEMKNSSITTTQTAVVQEGLGYDVKQMEYEANGWTEPYRLYSLNGVETTLPTNAVETSTYDIVSLTYDQESIGAWLEYKNNEATIIAIPEADTRTRNSLITALDSLLSGTKFEPLADDAQSANTSSTVIEQTTTKTGIINGLA